MSANFFKKNSLKQDIKELKSLPVESALRTKIIERLLIAVEHMLRSKADEPVKALLLSSYICPGVFRISQEKNIAIISDTVVTAFTKPGVTQKFRLASSIASSTKKSLVDICDKNLGPHITTTFGRTREGDLLIKFLAN